MLERHSAIRPIIEKYDIIQQESLANAKVNARQHCVSLSWLGDEDSENIAS